MHRIAAKFVPRLLTPDQKELRAEICKDLHQCELDNQTFMLMVITWEVNLVLRVRPRDQPTVFAVEEPNISTT